MRLPGPLLLSIRPRDLASICMDTRCARSIRVPMSGRRSSLLFTRMTPRPETATGRFTGSSPPARTRNAPRTVPRAVSSSTPPSHAIAAINLGALTFVQRRELEAASQTESGSVRTGYGRCSPLLWQERSWGLSECEVRWIEHCRRISRAIPLRL
ncbi:hypothetical protein BD626DRAFT_491393 [Schizophyllum amplum]|uniref:Uncharacterized protein n=1 Tax=Schizophyllum amplum TaxID=97359 RepID=A0A550CHV1_9AGAR|nr:hypothetical protein BD626DRAFT_491393 [Auriculariopsis ampla]